MAIKITDKRTKLTEEPVFLGDRPLLIKYESSPDTWRVVFISQVDYGKAQLLEVDCNHSSNYVLNRVGPIFGNTTRLYTKSMLNIPEGAEIIQPNIDIEIIITN